MEIIKYNNHSYLIFIRYDIPYPKGLIRIFGFNFYLN